MIDNKAAEQTAIHFFEAIDNRDWSMFESTMIDHVNITMKSPEREKNSIMTNEAISSMWQDQFAMVYDKTSHVIKNLEVVIKDEKAIVKVDIDSTHFLGDEHWTGIGTYIFTITAAFDKYKITDINYTLQIVDGDVELRDRMVAQRKY